MAFTTNFVDTGPSALTVSTVGTPAYDVKTPISGRPGSVLFNGTTDYLTVPSDSSLNFGASSDFTVEAWVNIANFSTNHGVCGKHQSTSTNSGYGMYITTSGILVAMIYSSGTVTNTSATTSSIAINTWAHIAMVRRSGKIQAFINGVGGTQSATTTNNADNTSLFYVGVFNGFNNFPGYISNVRVSNIARYSTTFFPGALSVDANTMLFVRELQDQMISLEDPTSLTQITTILDNQASVNTSSKSVYIADNSRNMYIDAGTQEGFSTGSTVVEDWS